MDSCGLRPHERAALALAVHGDAPLALEQFSAQEIGSAGWWGIVARSTLQDHATLAVSTLERVRAHWGRVDAATYLLRHPAERATALAALEEAALDGYVHALHTLVAHDHGTPVLAAWLAAQLTSPTRVSYRTAWEDDDLLAVWARAFRSLFPEEPVPERR